MDLNAKIEARRKELAAEAENAKQAEKAKEDERQREILQEIIKRTQNQRVNPNAASSFKSPIDVEGEKLLNKAAFKKMTTDEKIKLCILIFIGLYSFAVAWQLGLILTACALLYGFKKFAKHKKDILSEDSVTMRADNNQEQDHFESSKQIFVDSNSGLMWARNGNIAGKAMNWNDAKRWVLTLNHGGYSDWCLPTIQEIDALTKQRWSNEKQRFDAASDFDLGKCDSFWTSSIAEGVDVVWFLYMQDGNGYKSKKTFSHYVWPVRRIRST